MPAFNMPTLKISHKLIGGFTAVVLLLAAAVGTTLWEVKGVKNLSDRIVHLRTPTAEASALLTSEIYASLANLRGWMLTGNASFKKERAAVWRDIAKTRADMDKLSSNWTNPKNVSAWADFKATLDEFAAAQDKVETIANSVDEQPATKMLVKEAAPLAGVMVKKITEMIDLELSGSQVTNELGNRVQFLGIMADVRGTLGLGLANIRAYLLTGNNKFVEKFKALWAKNNRRFADLENAANQMSPAQKKAFDVFAKKRGEFVALPPKMFAIRGSKKWNMANYTLVTEAAPRAGKLLTALVGPKSEDGTRSGGMVANQKKLMLADAGANAENISGLLTMQWALLALGIAAGGAIAFFTMRSISPPLIRMTGAMRQLADGDLETEVPGQDRKDEIGDMSGAVQVFKDNALRNKELEKEQEEKRQVDEKRQAVISAATIEFDASIGDIVNTVSSAATELNSTSQSMASISEETSSQASSVASASELASTNVQTVASATEEMTASISEINTQVAQASEISKQAVENVEKTTTQMDELAKTADKVGEVVSMISDIAEQTNLLADNDTNESARAGEAGKGFAVVASEVKALANETAKATEEIAEHIQKIQAATKGAVISIDDIGTVVKQLEQTSTAIAAGMEEQGSTTQEISRSVQEAATGTQEVTSSIAGVTQASQEAGAASGEVTTAAGELSQQAEKMKTEVDKFLNQVRTA